MSQMNKTTPAEKKYLQEALDWIASQMEEDEMILNTMDQITAYCGNDCADEVSSKLYDIIGRASDIAAGLIYRGAGGGEYSMTAWAERNAEYVAGFIILIKIFHSSN